LVAAFLLGRGSVGNANAKLAVQTLNHFARKITIDLKLLDRNTQAFKCIAEVKARFVEASDVLMREGETKRKRKKSVHHDV
jgi:hypothetical protein